MDPNLRRFLEEGNDEDEVAAILRLGQPGSTPEGVRIVTRFGDIATVRLRRSTIPDVRASAEVASMKAPSLLVPEPAVDPPGLPQDLPPWADDRRPRTESATGRGVVVGVIDFGLDFAHPDFRHPDGRTRLLALWDQSARPASGASNRYGYGVIHSAEAINRALETDDPYAALGYHPAASDPGQEGAHGTHVAGIAAGNGRAGGAVGVAPEADMIFVQHSSRFVRKGMHRLGDSVTLLEAVDFIAQTAGEKPWAINISMGSHGGQHDGTTLVEQGLDAALRAAPGRAVSQSAGNYYQQRCHTSGRLREGEERTFVWEIDEADVTSNELEAWYSGRDVFVVELRSPDRTLLGRAALGERISLTLGGREVGSIYHRQYEPNSLDNHIDIFLYPGAPPGDWQVTLIAQDVVDGHFHAWIERDAICEGCQSRFPPQEAVPSTTTGAIANGFRTISVGAYDPHSQDQRVAPFSSCGPTRDDRSKPDLVAPGVNILAARSAPWDGHDGTALLTRMSGTSMASPHVAGALALMFEVAPRPLRIEETRNLLTTSTRKASAPQEMIDRVGSGYLDLDKAIEAARHGGQQYLQLQPQSPSSSGEMVAKSEEVAKSEDRAASPEEELVEQADDLERLETGEVYYAAISEHDEDSAAETYPEDLSEEELEQSEFLEEEEEMLLEQSTSKPWNVYMYVVGTDKRGRSDFNEMRKLLQKETDYEEPWVAVTYDFKKGESDPTKGELRKSWKKSSSARLVNETYPLGTDFSIVYRDIEALSTNNQQIKHLHILTHFANDTVWAGPYTSSSTADLAAVDRPAFAAAFAPDAVVKFHGCQQDRELKDAIAEFCNTSDETKRSTVLQTVRDRIEKSYPYQLAVLIDRRVQAAPMGTYAIYECSYLSSTEKGRRFCIETDASSTHTAQRTLRFYQANYDQIFDRKHKKPIFDKTYHMFYEPLLRSASSMSPVPCASSLSPSEVVYQDAMDGASVSELVSQADYAVYAGEVTSSPESLLHYLLATDSEFEADVGMEVLDQLSPAKVFDALTTEAYPALRTQLEQVFEVVATPLSPTDGQLRSGDVLVRRFLGEGDRGHMAVLVTGDVLPADELEIVGLRPESDRPGGYSHVVETGASPHTVDDGFARRLTRDDGRLDYDTIVLRLRSDAASRTTLPAESEAALDDEAEELEGLFPGEEEEQEAEAFLDEPGGEYDGGVQEAVGLIVDSLTEALASVREQATPTQPLIEPRELQGIPFAPPPPEGSYWPVVTSHGAGREVTFKATEEDTNIYADRRGKKASRPGRRFLANRSGGKRWHVGVDLFANVGDPVVACEDGTILSKKEFYKAASGQMTCRLLIEHSQVVVNYGEILCGPLPDNLREGGPVEAGQVIGRVSDTSMLHFETYVKGARRTFRWMKHEKTPPQELLNPTKYLLFLQEHGLAGSGAKGQPVPSVGATGQPAPSVSPSVPSPTPRPIDVDRAVRLNRRYAQSLGWQAHVDRIVALLGLEEELALAVGRWQSGQSGLVVDGIIGENTWARMQPLLEPDEVSAAPSGGGQTLAAPSGGIQAPAAPAGDLAGFTASEQKALRITNAFENTGAYVKGRRDLSFDGLAGDFDKQGLSFGLLQWNIGTGSLQPLLEEFDRDHGERFNAVFGLEAAQLREVLKWLKDARRSKSMEAIQAAVARQLEWARSINDYSNPKNPRIKEPWSGHFRRLGEDTTFQKIQFRHARSLMDKAVDYARRFELRSERGLAFMFDVVSGHGGGWLDSRKCHGCKSQTRRARIEQQRAELERQTGSPPTERQLLEIIANVLAKTVIPKYEKNVLRRRMTIVEGQGTVHGHPFDLARDFGLTDQPWEGAPSPSVPSRPPSAAAPGPAPSSTPTLPPASAPATVPAPPAPAAGAPPRSGLRQRIVDTARREWERWDRGQKVETDPEMRDILRGYWEAVLSRRQEAEKAIDDRLAWSAAFVSWVMKQAGAGEAFKYSSWHYIYISAAKRSFQRGDASKFWAYDITEAKPEVGDLVCRDRRPNKKSPCSGTTYANVDNGNSWLTHSDIVVEVGAGRITVIGGNVGGPRCKSGEGCTVNAKTLRIDSNGFVIPDQSDCRYFAIVKVR